MKELKKLVVIVGPTAVGKTALSLEIAQIFNGEIISGDSMQIYQGLPIGTAQVTPEEMGDIPHYLVNELPLETNYSAYDFKQAAEKSLEKIVQNQHLPILVGGTGLYIQGLLEGYSHGESQGESSTAQEEMLATNPEENWEKLAQQAPDLAQTTHPNNQRRVLRALERGKSEKAKSALYDVFLIGLETNRELLYERINQRVDLMVDQGLLAEAKRVYDFSKQHPNEKLTVLQAIGYKELFPYFAGEISLEEGLALVKRNSRRYAKRQLTWFKNRMAVPFYDLLQHPEEKEKLMKALKIWLKGGQA